MRNTRNDDLKFKDLDELLMRIGDIAMMARTGARYDGINTQAKDSYGCERYMIREVNKIEKLIADTLGMESVHVAKLTDLRKRAEFERDFEETIAKMEENLKKDSMFEYEYCVGLDETGHISDEEKECLHKRLGIARTKEDKDE